MAAPVPGDVIRVLCITSSDPSSARRAAIVAMFDGVLGKGFELGFSASVDSRKLKRRPGLVAAARQCGLLDPAPPSLVLPDAVAPYAAANSADEGGGGGTAAAAAAAAAASGADNVAEPSPSAAAPSAAAAAAASPPPFVHPRGFPPSSIDEDEFVWLCKGLNRERATLACTFAHLAAQRKAVEEGWDIIIEDNVRVVREGAAALIRQTAAASPAAALRYYSYNGKQEDIAYLFSAHGPMGGDAGSGSPSGSNGGSGGSPGAVPFPLAEHKKRLHSHGDGAAAAADGAACIGGGEDGVRRETGAGGDTAAASTFNPMIWGNYAYSIGCDGYDRLLLSIRADLGTIVWRPKRAKKSRINPIDRVMPRKIQTLPPGGVAGVPATAAPFTAAAATVAAFFRGPMLKSMIHPKWDHESCETVAHQLAATGRSWDTVWLTSEERASVAHHAQTGKWLHYDDIVAAAPQVGEEQQAGHAAAAAAAASAAAAALSFPSSSPSPAVPVLAGAASAAPFHSPPQISDTSTTVADQLTIIVITSAILSHPNPEMILKVIESISQIDFSSTSSVDRCAADDGEQQRPPTRLPKLLFVGDGVEEGSTYHPKKGKVPAAVRAAYLTYLDTLDGLIKAASPGTLWARGQVLRLPSRVGFGHAVKAGLLEATSEYVMVVQHDHAFSRGFPVGAVLRFMTAHRANYVNLPKSSTFKHLNRCHSDYHVNVRNKSVQWEGGSVFIPMLFWYDGPHLARRRGYLDLVFNSENPLPKGHFIEDTFGHQMMDQLRQNYDLWFPKYRSYAYVIDATVDAAFVYHLDGRKYVVDTERVVKGWQENSSLATKEKRSRQGRQKMGLAGGDGSGGKLGAEEEEVEVDEEEVDIIDLNDM